MTVLVGAAAGGAALGLIVWLVATVRPAAHAEVMGNLATGLTTRSQATSTRPERPWLTALQRMVHPTGLALVDRLLTRAGRPKGWTAGTMLAAKAAGVTLMAPIAVVLASAGGGRVVVAIVALIVTFFTPELLLYSKGQERQQRIGRELADTLDQMTISVEAGLGFDAAMARAAAAGRGPLAEEFVRTLQEIQVGVPRREAFRGLSRRTTVVDLQRFVSALLQSDAYGVPLVDTLRIQAEEIRRKRRFRAEQRAMQVPVKVVFPLIVCILPTLFIVLLGPAIISMIAIFSGG